MVDYQIVGAIGSPYSRKLRAVFRYRRIPHVWIHRGAPEAEWLPKPRVALLPQLVVRGESGALEALIDSTPILRMLERRRRRCHAPFLIANAAALAAGHDRVECEIDGERWTQTPFPYQAKCLEALRADYHALAASDRDAVDRALSGTGCEVLFA